LCVCETVSCETFFVCVYVSRCLREREREGEKRIWRERRTKTHTKQRGKEKCSERDRERERETVTVRGRKRGRERERERERERREERERERKTEIFTQDKEGKRVPGTGDKPLLAPVQCSRLGTGSVRVGSAMEPPFEYWLVHTRERANEIRKNVISFEPERAAHIPPPRHAWMQSYVPSFNH